MSSGLKRKIEGATVSSDSSAPKDPNRAASQPTLDGHPYPPLPPELMAQLGELSLEELVYWKLSQLPLSEIQGGVKGAGLHEGILECVERPLFLLVLERTNSRQVKAAEILGLNRNTLHRRLKELGIEPRDFRKPRSEPLTPHDLITGEEGTDAQP